MRRKTIGWVVWWAAAVLVVLAFFLGLAVGWYLPLFCVRKALRAIAGGYVPDDLYELIGRVFFFVSGIMLAGACARLAITIPRPTLRSWPWRKWLAVSTGLLVVSLSFVLIDLAFRLPDPGAHLFIPRAVKTLSGQHDDRADIAADDWRDPNESVFQSLNIYSRYLYHLVQLAVWVGAIVGIVHLFKWVDRRWPGASERPKTVSRAIEERWPELVRPPEMRPRRTSRRQDAAIRKAYEEALRELAENASRSEQHILSAEEAAAEIEAAGEAKPTQTPESKAKPKRR